MHGTSTILHNITLHGAQAVRDKAMETAGKHGIAISIFVVDLTGTVILAQTMDGASPGAADAALMKAKSAARYRVPTHLTAEFIKTLPAQLGPHALSLPELCAFQGGVPVKLGDQVIGGVGVAGGSGAQDVEIASGAANSLD